MNVIWYAEDSGNIEHEQKIQEKILIFYKYNTIIKSLKHCFDKITAWVSISHNICKCFVMDISWFTSFFIAHI